LFLCVNKNTPEDFDMKLNEYKPLLSKLVSYYIAERYPTYKEKLSSMLDKKEALNILNSTMEVYLWLKSLKK